VVEGTPKKLRGRKITPNARGQAGAGGTPGTHGRMGRGRAGRRAGGAAGVLCGAGDRPSEAVKAEIWGVRGLCIPRPEGNAAW